MQTKVWSVIEIVIGLMVGIVISFAIQRNLFPLYGIYIQPQQDIQIVLVFTAASFIRGYLIRRLFNAIHRSKK